MLCAISDVNHSNLVNDLPWNMSPLSNDSGVRFIYIINLMVEIFEMSITGFS